MSQTMLLPKRLSLFLSTHTTPTLPTLLLLSPTGKVLSSASPLPASTLRTHATLAVSLWTLYHPFEAPLPSQGQNHTLPQPQNLDSITLQLEFGIMCIRALSSGLLFVAVGQSSPHIAEVPGSPGIEGHGSMVSLQGSETGTVGSIGERSGSGIWAVRRQAEEVGRWLEGRLEGFNLSASER